jgi:hypothetical protein
MQHRYMLHHYICYILQMLMPIRLLMLMLPDRHCHATLPHCHMLHRHYAPHAIDAAMLHAIRRHATCHMPHAMPHATCHITTATCHISPPTCHMPRRHYCHYCHYCHMLHATCATCYMLHTALHYYMPYMLHATCYMLYCYMLHATCYILLNLYSCTQALR